MTNGSYNTTANRYPNYYQNTTAPVPTTRQGTTTSHYTTGPQFITGNGQSPYNPQYPGGYGANAAKRAWSYASKNPLALKNTTIQMSPYPNFIQNETMVNLLGYAWEDFKHIDGLGTGYQDKKIDLNELTNHFRKVTQYPQSAQNMAKKWLEAYDSDKNNVVTVDEHLASNIFELGASSFEQRLGNHLNKAIAEQRYNTPVEQSIVDRQLQHKAVQMFDNLTPFSTPAEREKKANLTFTQSSLVNKITDSIKKGLQLQQYATAFRLMPTPVTTPNSNPYAINYQA